MSEETQIQQQEPDQPTQSYISRVRLKGYKSIIDTEVEFKPGLNIIIGANGSGKTNFVEFLNLLLNLRFDTIQQIYSAQINILHIGENFNVRFKKSFLNLKDSSEVVTEFSINDENIYINTRPPMGKADKWKLYFEFKRGMVSFVSHGTPESFQNISNLIKFEFLTEEVEVGNTVELLTGGYGFKTEPTITRGIEKLLQEVFTREILQSIDGNRKPFWKEKLVPSHFTRVLKNFTPIKDIKVPTNFNVRQEKTKWTVDYVKFEFLVNDQWLTWNQLSDGTKRIFYIITEITFANNVVLLEEPELGIHPHQLKRLMDFIIEQSETKQIIITTHSPEVLNSLGMDELDRIIIARYDKEKGTQLHHLSEEEMGHARSYMETEGLFLSDYWVYSGFEKEEEEV